MDLHFTSLLEYGVQHISNTTLLHTVYAHLIVIMCYRPLDWGAHIPAITCIGGALYDALDHPAQDRYANGTWKIPSCSPGSYVHNALQ